MQEDKFLAFVESEATKIGKIFILDSGEGNDFYDEENQFEVENLSGWLIDESQQEQFIEAREKNNENEHYGENYTFVKWEKNDGERLKVTFEKY